MTNIFILCVCFCISVHGQFADLSNLGATIENSVRQSLEPLNNLGQQIENNVRASLEPMNRDLENLGSQISQQVETSLLPVKAMAMRLEMMHGVGGKTIVKFPNGKNFVAKPEGLQECTGAISDQGDCQGSLSSLDMNIEKNFCYITPNVRVNNYLCLSNGDRGLSVTNINGKVTCTSQNNSPILLISEDDYRKLCEDVGRPTFTYIADLNDPLSVKIPSNNPYLKCQNNEPNICVFN